MLMDNAPEARAAPARIRELAIREIDIAVRPHSHAQDRRPLPIRVHRQIKDLFNLALWRDAPHTARLAKRHIVESEIDISLMNKEAFGIGPGR
jgi:hypothetical protein